MTLPSTKPTATEVLWKYRSEAIETCRIGVKLNKPNTDSDPDIDGIQNEGIITVDFLAQAEKIDLYYRPLNEVGRGPVVDIVSTGRTYKLASLLSGHSALVGLRGDTKRAPVVAESIIKIDDEMMVVETANRTPAARLQDGLVEFWSLNEEGGEREGIKQNLLDDYTEHPVGSGVGRVMDSIAAEFTGNAAQPQALYSPYKDALGIGDAAADGFSVSAWVRLSNLIGDKTIVSRWCGAGRYEYQLRYNAGDNRFEFVVRAEDGTNVVTSVDVVPGAADWLHVVGVCDLSTNNIRIHVQGVGVNQSDTTPFVGTVSSSGAPLSVGARLQDNVNDPMHPSVRDSFAGNVASVGFWKRPLTVGDVGQLFDVYDLSLFIYDALNLTVIDRGAHGTVRAQHAADAEVTVMRSTVPTNSIVMDSLLDAMVPGHPESLVVSASGDDAEIGIEVDVVPPTQNNKTLKRIQVQASTTLWPADLRHTTGLDNILVGPRTGTIKQGGRVLIADNDFVAPAAPYHLYTYEDIDLTTGVINYPRVYQIESINGREITIVDGEFFSVMRGAANIAHGVNFVIARGWLGVPTDYVVNDTPLTAPTAGDALAVEPFHNFYKTTKNVYVRSRYTNGPGAGQWMYWDGNTGSMDRNDAVTFHPAGIPQVTIENIYMFGDLVRDANGDIVQPPALDRTNLQTPVSVNDAGNEPAGWSILRLDPTEANPVVVYTRRMYDVDTAVWGAYVTPQIDRIWIGLEVPHARTGAPLAPTTSFTPAALETSELYAFLVGVGRNIAERELVVLGETQVQISKDPNAVANWNAVNGFTDATMLVHAQTLSPAPVLWTAPIGAYDVYALTARVRNAKDGTYSPWRDPISQVTSREGIDIGFANAVQLRVENTGVMSDVRRLVITRPTMNFNTLWGYDVQARTGPFPADTDYENYTLQLSNIRYRGTGLININDNTFVIENVMPAIGADDLVDKILYIHKGISANNEVRFPHSDPITGYVAADNEVTVTPTQRYRVESSVRSPITDADRRFEFVIADDYIRTSQFILILENINILNSAGGGVFNVPPETARQFTLPAGAHVRVRPNNLYGASRQSNVVIVGSTDVPDNVMGLHASLLTAMGMPVIEVDWEPSADATHYEWREATSLVGGDPNYGAWTSTTATEVIRSNVQAGTTYYFQVRAVNSNGESAMLWPTTMLIVGMIATMVPATVSGLSATVSGRTITVSWDAAARATSYEWRERAGLTGEWSDWTPVTGTSITRQSRTRGVVYYYEVRAVNSIGNSPAPHAGASVLVPAIVAPTPSTPGSVTGLTATLSQGTTVTVSWNAVDNADSYWISQNGGQRISTTSTSRVYTSRTPGTTYTYAVYAANSSGAGPTAVVTITIPAVASAPGSISGLSATFTIVDFPGASPTLTFSWNAADDATSYAGTVNGSAFTSTSTRTSLSVAYATTYTIVVHAVNAVGNGPSAMFNYTTPAQVATPSAPTGFSATSNHVFGTRYFVNLSWTAAANASSHEWRRGSGSWLNVGSDTSDVDQGHFVDGVPYGTHTYQVRGVNSEGTAGPSVSTTVTVP